MPRQRPLQYTYRDRFSWIIQKLRRLQFAQMKRLHEIGWICHHSPRSCYFLVILNYYFFTVPRRYHPYEQGRGGVESVVWGPLAYAAKAENDPGLTWMQRSLGHSSSLWCVLYSWVSYSLVCALHCPIYCYSLAAFNLPFLIITPSCPSWHHHGSGVVYTTLKEQILSFVTPVKPYVQYLLMFPYYTLLSIWTKCPLEQLSRSLPVSAVLTVTCD